MLQFNNGVRLGTVCSSLIIIIGLTSCGNARKAYRELLYLQGNLDTLPNKIVPAKEVAIQKGDLLSIVVYSDNAEATALFNQQGNGSASSASAASGATGGYLVDQAGNIQFHSLGLIQVEGINKLQLTQKLTDSLRLYLKNPYVTIRFLNFRFTVIGEVLKPGSYTIPEEKISILEMLGLAGDLTVYGRRDNILVIREREGKREFGRLDLRKNNIFQSPYFYLQQNDVVVVEPNPKKPTVNDQVTARNLTIASGIAALASTIAIIFNIFK
ncbi:MAG: polysaccharide biosynthesis/export family protein [Chitinophagaceae bacterium]|nr:polysaccharide biosynthesis/export family protein [Chitinophagaceae bacterium]